MEEPQPVPELSEFEIKPQMPRPRSRTIAQVAVGLGALALVVLGAALIVNRGAAPAEDPLAKVMPPDTLAYFALGTHPDQLPNFEAVADAWKGSKEAKQVDSALRLALSSANLDWDEDVEPWLGDRVAIGIVDVGGPEESTEGGDDSPRVREPFFVVAAQTRDREQSGVFLDKFRKMSEENLYGDRRIVDEVYRDIPIVYVAGDSSSGASEGEAYATIDDVIVLTNGSANLKKVIDTLLDGPSLASGANFQATMGALPAQNAAAFYMDYGKYFETIMKLVPATSEIFGEITAEITGDEAARQKAEEERRKMEEQFASMKEMVQAFGGLGVTMSYEPGGIRFDAAMQMHLDRLPESMREIYASSLSPVSNRIFEAVPASAVFAMNVNNPAASWKALLNDPGWQSLTFGMLARGKAIPDELANLEKTAGVDLEADLLDLLGGEMAFVVLPKSGATPPAGDDLYPSFNPPFEIAVMFDSTDAVRATDSLNKLFEALRQPPESSFARVQPLDSLQGSALLEPDGDIVLAYGVIDGRLVIGSHPDTLRAVDDADQSPLSQDDSFQEAVGKLSANRLTTMYAQPAPILNWYVSLFSGFSGDPSAECGVCNYLKPVKWLSAGGTAPDLNSGLSFSTMHVGLEPAE